MRRDLPPFAPPPSTVKVQHLRRLTQAGFFLLFVFAPLLNLFRFDLDAGHFIVLGLPWTLVHLAVVTALAAPASAAEGHSCSSSSARPTRCMRLSSAGSTPMRST